MATNAASVFTSSWCVSAIQHGPEGRAYAHRSNIRPCRTRFAGSVSQKRDIRTSWVALVRRRAAYCLIHIHLSGVPNQMRSSDLRGQFRHEIACAHGQVLQPLYSNNSGDGVDIWKDENLRAGPQKEPASYGSGNTKELLLA
jgi:hypothetical protein